MWTIFKVFIEFVTILFLFSILVSWLWGRWDLMSQTRDQTRTPGTRKWSLNNWTTREVPFPRLFVIVPAENQNGYSMLFGWQDRRERKPFISPLPTHRTSASLITVVAGSTPPEPPQIRRAAWVWADGWNQRSPRPVVEAAAWPINCL